MKSSENKNPVAQRGDLILMMRTRPMLVAEEGTLLACFWSLGRVTGVAQDGIVSAFRIFGTHYVCRDVPENYQLLSATLVDMPAIEGDMTNRVGQHSGANEFPIPDHAYEYATTFMLETTNNGV
ncbi:hypothetical protein HDG34_003188 [Paraburkholderia sp. HC6.4b]|uniref:hypothetical protein n=1 Tax=unclassified Paraburkholderia TaxID=2615204 RepID=UPI0016128B40|nr:MULTISPECIES: hypothetical protein [unclassified Paraburkholderia]MBB5409247.1 hypothetical protein [Paraburkholderia sp. HC6.4b]MBB5450975.1 hypothetical protein [Paraburkholderia sp. Kb1A]